MNIVKSGMTIEKNNTTRVKNEMTMMKCEDIVERGDAIKKLYRVVVKMLHDIVRKFGITTMDHRSKEVK